VKEFVTHCEEMSKIDDLDIYTVAYSINNKQLENALRGCVTGDGQYYDTSVENLDAVFKKVKDSLLPISLSQ